MGGEIWIHKFAMYLTFLIISSSVPFSFQIFALGLPNIRSNKLESYKYQIRDLQNVSTRAS